MPISRLVAVSFRPASSVLSRTLARTGSVLRLDTARLTTDRPRARFSCMTESFTSGSLHLDDRWFDATGDRELGGRRSLGTWVVGIFSLSSHPVITVVRVWRRWTVTLGVARPRR